MVGATATEQEQIEICMETVAASGRKQWPSRTLEWKSHGATSKA